MIIIELTFIVYTHIANYIHGGNHVMCKNQTRESKRYFFIIRQTFVHIIICSFSDHKTFLPLLYKVWKECKYIGYEREHLKGVKLDHLFISIIRWNHHFIFNKRALLLKKILQHTDTVVLIDKKSFLKLSMNEWTT